MKKAQRPIDVKDMLWSVLGKDALDAAAEASWEAIRHDPERDTWVQDGHTDPYHLLPSGTQAHVQRAVLAVLVSTVPGMLRERAKEYGTPPADDYDRNTQAALREFADEIEGAHG